MMTMKTALFSFLLVVLASTELALASPFGASSCEGGEAAVSGPHLSAAVGTGNNTANAPSIESGGFVLNIGPRIPPTTDTNPLDLETQSRYPLTLFSEQCSAEDASYECALTLNPFRGFLMRLGRGNKGVDTSESFELEADDFEHSNSQLLSLCQQEEPSVGGITHVNNTIKARAGAFISLPYADTNVTLDVTVVVRNCGPNSTGSPVEPCDPSNSTYYFTRYYLEFQGEEAPMSSASSPSASVLLLLVFIATTAWLSFVVV